VKRREFLVLAGGGLLSVYPPIRQSAQTPDSLPGTGPAGRLWDPARAGRPIEPVTARDNLAAIQAIEKQLRCTCGCGLDIYTCRTTDFSCSYSPALHQEVLKQYEAGSSAQQIIDDFVRRNGIQSLMAPPKRGFNLAGYFVPGTAVLVAAVILTMVLRRWTRAGVAAAEVPPPAVPDATPAELERLRHDLEQIQS
jgi:cytochrome c-type biogenesis protein CcmH/NrfF